MLLDEFTDTKHAHHCKWFL